MFSSVLVANRGEIARRVFRTARRMGLRTIAVYSDADARAPHVREADAAVRIGPPAARESYLRGDLVIAAAKEAGAEAIHPGYGFLSENAEFAAAVVAAGLIWVGPPPAAIRAMGLKDAAKRLMAEAGVPVTPGWLGENQSAANLSAQADEIGYPVLIKAVAGGGGKGMRRVDDPAAFGAALASAQREAAAAFGDDRVLLERYLTRPRHIEVQVFGDAQGQVVHLFERDCSLQRRHQKVIEEAPAPGMDAATREAVCAAAVRAAQAVNYVGAGTVEFIADASEGLRADRVFFMEMNTRLQVEHPVSEAITGVDLVEWQFRVAAGEPLPLAQDAITLTGHAIEARLYAEDPSTGFLPSVGRLEHFRLPQPSSGGEGTTTLRIDSAVEEGGEVTPFYDPMIAKLIVHADTREAAAAGLTEACAGVEAWPVRTNASFLVRCLEHPDFVAGEVDTAFIPSRVDALAARFRPSHDALQQVGVEVVVDFNDPDGRSPWSPWAGATGFRLNDCARSTAHVWLDDERVEVPICTNLHSNWFATRRGDLILYGERGATFAFSRTPPTMVAGMVASGAVLAPMPGRIVATSAAAGESVTKGQPLVVLEAMKMEHAMIAPFDGVVAELPVAVGDQVVEGALLVRLDPAAGA